MCAKMNRKHLYYLTFAAILFSLAVALPWYYNTDQHDDWRSAEAITHGYPRIVVPTFNNIPMMYYAQGNVTGYTWYSEVPENFSGFVIVGPAGGYDPPMQAWFTNLTVYKNVTGITIYHT